MTIPLSIEAATSKASTATVSETLNLKPFHRNPKTILLRVCNYNILARNLTAPPTNLELNFCQLFLSFKLKLCGFLVFCAHLVCLCLVYLELKNDCSHSCVIQCVCVRCARAALCWLLILVTHTHSLEEP